MSCRIRSSSHHNSRSSTWATSARIQTFLKWRQLTSISHFYRSFKTTRRKGKRKTHRPKIRAEQVASMTCLKGYHPWRCSLLGAARTSTSLWWTFQSIQKSKWGVTQQEMLAKALKLATSMIRSRIRSFLVDFKSWFHSGRSLSLRLLAWRMI